MNKGTFLYFDVFDVNKKCLNIKDMDKKQIFVWRDFLASLSLNITGSTTWPCFSFFFFDEFEHISD